MQQPQLRPISGRFRTYLLGDTTGDNPEASLLSHRGRGPRDPATDANADAATTAITKLARRNFFILYPDNSDSVPPTPYESRP